ncbi:lytic polysaccharide monooxygenase [Streptomyces sp. NPDC096193]|uniref:lytic polysaccharide monooxygenase auxiliary activity family 9 protein n=1 Tax=Streptomyces sp. NPDC096193 TaxID=3155821 RepID=UPI003323010C
MTAHRTATVAALAGVVPLVLTALAAGPAQAHGAPTDPLSRIAACGPEGIRQGSAACRTAVAANGGTALGAWDNLRVADVRGRDRQVIPDGQLCSAGLRDYRGLDTTRANWPTTPLKAGAGLTMTYRSTIPHRGTFSLYLTEEGYDPAAPLRWSDLRSEPFARVTDPPLRDGAYRIRGKLPAGLTGRHVLYTIWRNTDTPDTYYSCSDVVLRGEEDTPPARPAPEEAAAPPPQSQPPTAEPPADDASAAGQAPPPQASTPPSVPEHPVVGGAARPQAVADTGKDNSTVLIGAVAAVLALLAVSTSVLLRRRR